MVWTQRWLTGTAAIAVALMMASGAQAGWFGFGNRTANQGQGVTLAQSSGDTARLDQLEHTIRDLTGQVETLQHQLDELTKQIQSMQADNEYRFSQLEHGKSGGKRDNVAAAAPAQPTPPAPQAAPAAADQQLGAPPKDLGTLIEQAPAAPAATPAGAGQQPLDLSSLARGGSGGAADSGAAAPLAQAQQVGQPSGDPVADYKAAYELFVAGQYAAAEQAFRQFLDAYPGDGHAADATYWLGQSLFSRGMYREAALEFVDSHKRFPKSARAADTMLLLGKSLAGIPEREAACQTFAAALKQYPNMSNALRQRVISEQANAGC